MARFKTLDAANANEAVAPAVLATKYPFFNFNAQVEGDRIYLNMDAVPDLEKGMVCYRDIAIIVDLSGSMFAYYESGKVTRLVAIISDFVAGFDKDGIDIYFFSNGLVLHKVVKSASEVKAAVDEALLAEGALDSTMPTAAFRKFCEQLKQKKRSGTALFLTDGMMDDGGKELKEFYINYLHREFKTRDNFYCYAVEFGRTAFGALDELDGVFTNIEEDLFDLESADNLEAIASVMRQITGMSAIGSETVEAKAQVSSGAVIDMLNTDTLPNGSSSVQGLINKIMSFRVRSQGEFTMAVEVPGYETLKLKVTPRGYEADVQVL